MGVAKRLRRFYSRGRIRFLPRKYVFQSYQERIPPVDKFHSD